MLKIKCFLMSSLLIGCSSMAKPDAQKSQVTSPEAPQPIEAQATSQIPQVSRIEWQMCNITVLIRTPCTEPPALSYHWGEVKEIKIFKVKGLGNDEFVRAFVKSQGCFNYYDKPQAVGWYPISGTANEIQGKKAEAKIVSTSVLNEETLKSLLSFRSYQAIGAKCDALPEKAS